MTLQFCDTADDQEDTFVDLALMTGRARRLYEERHRELYERTDKWFASLIVVEWLASIAVALLVSPLAWSGTRSYIHPHIWFAILMGGVFILPVIYCVSFMPGKTLTRHVIAVNQMLFSALLIHLTGGRIETHFHIFGSLAFLAFYRDWRVLITASLVVLIDHLLRGIFIPQSVYGVLSASPWRSMEHAGWVIFEDVFLIKACLQNQNEMMMAARRQDQVESAGEELGALAEERSRLLQAIEAKYLSLCDVSPVGIFQNASDGRCIYVNRRLVEIYGCSEDEMLEEGWEDFLHPLDRERVVEKWYECVRNGDKYRDEFRILGQSGEVRWTKVEADPIQASEAGVSGYVGTVDDITERVDFESRLRMQYLAARLLTETRSPLVAGGLLLQSLCENDEWDFGALWVLDRKDMVMRNLSLWSRPELSGEELKVTYETTDFAPGEGLIGSVWKEKKTMHMPDIFASDLIRQQEMLRRADLNSVVTFPVMHKDEILGIMQFFCKMSRVVRPEMEEAFETIGRQFGQYIKDRESELSIARAQKKMASVLRAALDAFITTDESGVITDFNHESERAFGCLREAALGRNVSEFIEFEESSEGENGFTALARTSSGDLMRNRVERTARRSDGSSFPIELTVVPHEDENGFFFSAFIRDISEKRGAEMLTSMLASIVESSCDAIVGLSPEGRIMSWNPGAEQMYGYSTVEAVGEEVSLISPEAEEISSLISRIFSGESVQQLETVHKTSRGDSIEVSLSVSPVKDSHGRIEGLSIISRDITQKKAVEKRISEFYSTVSHELRTPLTSIRGALSLIDDEIIDLDSSEACEMVTIARQSSERLVRLINDILDLKKIEAGKLELHKQVVEADSILSRGIDSMAGMSMASGVIIRRSFARGVSVEIDPDRIMQVLSNLFSNAIKHSSPGQVILASLEPGAPGCIRFSITDEGPGIEPEHHDLIFARFQQIDSSDSRPKEGSGLGLAISRSIVEQHGGSMGFCSKPGVGSTFWFELPCRPIDRAPFSMPEREVGRSVLVVEDDTETSRFVMLQLSKEGFCPVGAPSLAAAKTVLDHLRPDVVVLDLGLPDGNGLDLIETMRKTAKLDSVPIIVTTGFDREELRCAPPLVFDWFTKPFEYQSLAETVRRAVDSNPSRKILVVEDDSDTRAVIVAQLKQISVCCLEADNGVQAVELARKMRPDVIILDVNIPGLSGFKVVEVLQELSTSMPSLVVYSEQDLSSSDRERLTLGITRHLNKSRVSPAEFVATVRDLLIACPV